MAVHFHKGKICFNGYLTEKDWTGIWLGSPFKYSSSCGAQCPAFLQKSCPASFFLLTHMILSPFDFDQFLLPVAGKKFSARAKSLRLPFLLSFFLSLKAGFSPMHYRLRAIRGGPLGVFNFTSHFIVIQIFQILFLPPVSFYSHPNISDRFVGDEINLFNLTFHDITIY